MRTRTLAALAAEAALAAGCGSQAGSAMPSQPETHRPPSIYHAPHPADPVAILRAAGTRVPAGEGSGGTDAFGDRMAEGTFGPRAWETVTVYAAGSTRALQNLLAHPVGQPDGYHGVIVLPGRRAVIAADAWQDNGPRWAAGGTPAEIAQRVHGLLIRH